MLNPSFQSLVKTSPILPVVSMDNVEDAVNVSKALYAGGINCVEIVLRTPCAFDCIQAVSEQVPEVTVGVGTLLTEEQVKRAVKMGAKFLVSPSFTPKLVHAMQDTGLPLLPGVVTPSEIAQAIEMGLTELKFFPAQQYGGINTLKALGSVFNRIKFCPTGGVNPKNARDYFELDSVFAVGGSWMVDKQLIKNQQWSGITQLSQQAIQLLQTLEDCA